MIDHQTYGTQLEPSDLPATVEKQVIEELSVDSAEITSGPDSGAELVVDSTLSRLEKRAVRRAVRESVDVERVVLNLRISFPEVRYEMCVQQ